MRRRYLILKLLKIGEGEKDFSPVCVGGEWMEKGKVASGVGGVFYMTNLGSKQTRT